MNSTVIARSATRSTGSGASDGTGAQLCGRCCPAPTPSRGRGPPARAIVVGFGVADRIAPLPTAVRVLAHACQGIKGIRGVGPPVRSQGLDVVNPSLANDGVAPAVVAIGGRSSIFLSAILTRGSGSRPGGSVVGRGLAVFPADGGYEVVAVSRCARSGGIRGQWPSVHQT